MAKFSDAVRATLTSHFNAGDQPTEAQFTALIAATQEGIEEHDHAGTGDGDGVNNLVGPVGIGCAPAYVLDVQGSPGVGAALLRLITTGGADDASVRLERTGGAFWNFGVNADNKFFFYDGIGPGLRMVLEHTTGNIGMGTSIPTFEWGGGLAISHASGAGVNLTGAAAGTLGRVLFTKSGSMGDSLAIIEGLLVGATGGSLGFSTQPDAGAVATRMTISSVGVVNIANLAGVGARNVVADAAGNLSAP